MKPKTVFLGEMTNPEIEKHLAARGSNPLVMIPIGSTEQHGPHGPLLTDTFIPTEVCRRVAGQIGALVAPSVPYGLSYPHKGFTGVVYLRMSTFAALVEDLCLQFATMGFKRIVFVNGHYDNTYAIAYACAVGRRAVAGRRPRLPDQLLGRHGARRSGPIYGHGRRPSCQQGRDVRGDGHQPGLRRSGGRRSRDAAVPRGGQRRRCAHGVLFSSPGSVYRATRSGAWGDGREASVEFGERYLDAVTAGTVRLLNDIERTEAAMPDR